MYCLFYYVVLCIVCRLCCSMYCFCVNVYCTTDTGCQPNCIIYHIISYHIISHHIISYKFAQSLYDTGGQTFGFSDLL